MADKLQSRKVIVVGSICQDNFVTLDPSGIAETEDGNFIMLKAGEKLSALSSTFRAGGGGMNIAVGLSRLGVEAFLVGSVGAGPESSILLREAEENGVNVGSVVIEEEKCTCKTTILRSNDYESFIVAPGASLSIPARSLSHSFWKHQPVSMVVLAPMRSISKEMLNAIFDISSSGTDMAFNPAPDLVERERNSALQIAARAKFLIMNFGEATTFAEAIAKASGDDISPQTIGEIVSIIRRLSPSATIAITEGKNGVFVANSRKLIHVPASTGTGVDTTGCGDAFSSGFLWGQLTGMSIEMSAVAGVENARGVLEKLGAQTGLLDKENLQRIIFESEVRDKISIMPLG